MASLLSTSRVFFTLFLLVALTTGGVGAAMVSVVNKCDKKVWPAATPLGGGSKLSPGHTWYVPVPAGTNGVRIWARTDCFGDHHGYLKCKTGDCNHRLLCDVSGKRPATVAELSVGVNADYYHVSVANGFNVPKHLSCSTGRTITCRGPHCPYGDKVYRCKGNSDYQVTFCRP